MLNRIVGRKPLAVLIVGLAPMVLRILLLPVLPMPSPRVHDEFSYLLAADTFAHGRLVNPAHPLWIHFESMHVLVRPVYASIFPIAQGLIMAAGGHPWVGVWLSMGLMCAALCWMLQGWVPPGWALLGGGLAAVRFGVFSYWMNSYFGGAMAAISGALLLGALPRVFRHRRGRDVALLAVGVAILANSRPYEGFVFSLLAGVALSVWIWRSRPSLRLFAPALLILGITAASMGYYFSRFSGSPFLLPYSLYRNNFTMAPHFVWQRPRPEPIYHHRVTRHFYTGLEMAIYQDARAGRSPHGLRDKAASYWRFYLGPFLTLPLLLTLPWLWKRRRTRYLLLAAAAFSLALAVEVWHAPHYAAPAMGLVLLLVVESLRHLHSWMVYIVILGCIVFPVSSAYQDAGHGEQRALVQNKLESSGGRHLAIVRYSLLHDPGNEWVYNGADIDGSAVVWAREMDPVDNHNLLRYFQGRRAWLVEPDATPPRLSVYDPFAPPDPPFRFVKLGTEAIAVLRDPDEIKRKVLDVSARDEYQPHQFSCDQWNFFFQQVTGVEPPDAGSCFAPGPRVRIVSFEDWFGWLKQQR
jgi:hypothetical protein